MRRYSNATVLNSYLRLIGEEWYSLLHDLFHFTYPCYFHGYTQAMCYSLEWGVKSSKGRSVLSFFRDGSIDLDLSSRI